MKRVALILAIVGLGINALLAQDPVRARDQQRTQLREHFMLQDGQMYQVRNGERLQLQSQMKLKNGTAINPDGSYQLKNGKQLRFKNGECMGIDGKRYKTQSKYMTRMNRMDQRRTNKPGSGQNMKKSGGKKGKGGN